MLSAVSETSGRGALGSNIQDWAHPIVAEWFLSRFGSPTEPQEQGWPHILAGRTTLIAAPTGSGKTLAAFLACIDRLVRKSLAGELRDRTEVLYVSPLKALGNDIQKNLEGPLAEIIQLASERGYLMPEIRTAVRTGDTLAIERQRMLRRPPHILVTTPESLYILLTAERSRKNLREVETVIVDEIHAVAGDKRGAHLLLSLERLEAHTTKPPVRIGLSATQKPLEEIAHFLTGADRQPPAVVDVGHRRQMDLAIEVPRSELGPIATNEQWDETYDRLAELAQQHRSTLVFVNTRRLAERVALHLGERLGEDQVAAHHGSLARKLRLDAERRLKSGQIKLLVATASLQLGIDIGFVDLVCQLESPRAIAVALQRIGRAGHWRGAIPKGRLFPATRDDLVECAALLRAIHHGDLDHIIIPDAPLDILAQQIVAEVAANSSPHLVITSENGLSGDDSSSGNKAPECGDGLPIPSNPSEARADFLPHLETGIDEDALFSLIKRAYPYRYLTRELFDSVLDMLAEGIAAKRGRYGAYIHRDRVNRKLRARRGARITAITSGGAIPETALFSVVAMPEEVNVGTVDEDYAVESMAGDIFLLGNTSWLIQRIETRSGRILVQDAHGQPPNIPFWRGEAPARTMELSSHVGALREHLSEMMGDMSPTEFTSITAAGVHHPSPSVGEGWDVEPSKLPMARVSKAAGWLKHEAGLDESGALQLIAHVLNGRAVLGVVPTQQTVVAERFFDEAGGMQLIIHAPFGARINKAWGLALRKRFCKSFNFELQAAATDNGLNISLAEQHSFPLADVFNFLQPETVGDVLQQAVLTGSPIFQTRWRWDANRSLALLRYQGGKKVPPQIQRMRSDDLLASVFPDVAACFENIEGDIRVPDHPLVKEVMKDVMHEAMDLDGLVQLLTGIRSGAVKAVAVDTPVPSQFAHEILNANPYAYLDDAPLEERRARAVSLRQSLPQSVLEEVGALDQSAIEEVREEAWPDVRDEDELADALFTLVAVPEELVARLGRPELYSRLLATGRATAAGVVDHRFWTATEKAKTFHAAYPWAQFESQFTEIEKDSPGHSDAVHTVVQGWMQHIGPTTAAGLASLLHLHQEEVLQSMLRLEASGTVLRGWYSLRRPADGNSLTTSDQQLATGIEWCERRLLARIHRLTIGRLRKEIEPVTPAHFMRWLFRWQHVEPGSQTSGEQGLLEVVRQMQGFEVPANAWERQVIARRLRDYDADALDQLCLMGTVGWGRLSPHPATINEVDAGRPRPARRIVPTSVAPITFFLREESDWMAMNPHLGVGAMREASEEIFSGLSPNARAVFDYLRERGASFIADIVRGTSKAKIEVETGLWELVAAGLVTADGFDNLRSLIDPARRNGKRSRPAGRWTLLYPVDLADRAKALEATCWMLLRRYGVVFRELLVRETMVPKWRELCIAFRRLEDRGEIRGGRFVSGFLGEQFALPIAVESLRAIRKVQPSGETITISAADPLNLVGIIVPGERMPAISGRYVSFKDGVFVSGEEATTPMAATGD